MAAAKNRLLGTLGALVAIACVAPATAGAVLPQPPPARPLPNPAFVTDETVNALTRSGDTIYLGGDFTRIGPPTGGSTVLDPATGLRAPQFPEVRGVGFAIVPDGAGGYYIGGRFTHVGGLPRKNLAHVLASGAVDPSFGPYVDNDVLALALDGGRLYVGGDFLHVGETIRRRLAALDPATGVVIGAFNPGADQSVQDLAVAGARMFVNGRFTGIAGHSRSGIAVLRTSDGELDPNFDAVPNGQVDAVLALGSRFYVGGTFTEVCGRSRAGLAAFDIATGNLDPAFSPSTNGNVYNLSTDGTRLFVAGHFTEIARAFNNAVASLDPITGEASQAFRLFLDKDAYTLAMVGPRLYIGGEFTKVNEQPRNKLAAVDLVTGAVDPAFDPDPDNDVYALAVTGARLVAGGKFTSAPRTKANHLAAVNAVTGVTVPTWAAGVDGSVTSLASADGRIFAGGQFRTANGAARQGLAGFDSVTGALSVLNVPVRGFLGTLATEGKRLYLGGSFDRVGGKRHPSLAAINLEANAVAPAFNAPRSLRRASFRYASVRAIVPRGSRILVGGDVSVSRVVGPKGKRRTQFRGGVVSVRATDASVDYAFAIAGRRRRAGARAQRQHAVRRRRHLAPVGHEDRQAQAAQRQEALAQDRDLPREPRRGGHGHGRARAAVSPRAQPRGQGARTVLLGAVRRGELRDRRRAPARRPRRSRSDDGQAREPLLAAAHGRRPRRDRDARRRRAAVHGRRLLRLRARSGARAARELRDVQRRGSSAAGMIVRRAGLAAAAAVALASAAHTRAAGLAAAALPSAARARAAGLAAAALALAAPSGAMAAGTVDPGFGSGGLATSPFGLGARAAAVALAPDGRIVVAGDTRGAGGEGALTGRFSTGGAADGSFAGDGGRVDTFGDGSRPQRAGAVAAQADGSVVVAGVAGDRWSVARFLPTGATDGLFGAAGVTLRDPTPGGSAEEEEFYPGEEPTLPDGTGPAAIAIAPSGQLVVAGSVGVANDDGIPSEQIVVARFNSNGLPDPTFGRDGFAVLQLGFGGTVRHAASTARGLALLPDGRVLIAGRASARDGGDRAFVARLMAGGALDRGFARDGRLLVQYGHASSARVASSSLASLALRPDGRIVAAGRATDVAGNHAVLLAGFTAAGAQDAAFARLGSAVSQLGRAYAPAAPVSLGRALALTPEGSAMVAGAATSGALAARYDATGALDCGYGTRGRTLAFGGPRFAVGTDGAAGAVLQPDGRLLMAGRRAGGGVLLGRLHGGAPARSSSTAARLVTLGARYIGRGRAYVYGLVDGACKVVNVRFSVKGDGPVVSTRVQRVFGRSGPQVVCSPLRGLRMGATYRIRLESSPKGGATGAQRTLRIAKPTGKVLPQEGCR